MTITYTWMKDGAREKLQRVVEHWEVEHGHEMSSDAYQVLYWYFRYSGLAGDGNEVAEVAE